MSPHLFSLYMCIHLLHIVTIFVHIFLDIVTLNKITNNKTILAKVRKQRTTTFESRGLSVDGVTRKKEKVDSKLGLE